MKTKELRELTEAEIKQKLTECRTELFNLRMQKATGRIEQPLRLRMLRRETARILTLMKQRGIK